ncbi:MAG TPA: adenosylcobinamide-GDP ribazoletransferase [Candidatus Binataceae bacterium]|nr:adenosylcobinamide-GDP ribazoletransferase [Candidatus Binataceae bacterium]
MRLRGERGAGWLAELRLAAGFLTILPVLAGFPAEPEAVAGSLGWFPLVGFVIGGVLLVEDFVLLPLFGDMLSAALVVLSLTVLTGAVHLDALADAADALGARADRRRALAVMRDSRIGSFGAVAIVLLLALEIVALATICKAGAARRAAALWIAPGLGRWAMAAVSWRIEYLRAEGAGTAILRDGGDRNLALASATVALAALPILSWRVVAACAAALTLAATLRAAYRRWLGGVTGDLIGAAGELVELAALLAMAAR